KLGQGILVLFHKNSLSKPGLKSGKEGSQVDIHSTTTARPTSSFRIAASPIRGLLCKNLLTNILWKGIQELTTNPTRLISGGRVSTTVANMLGKSLFSHIFGNRC